MMTGAAIAVSYDDRIDTAADAAFKEAREQIGGPTSAMQCARFCGFLDPGMALGKRRLLALDRCPEVIADDAKPGNRSEEGRVGKGCVSTCRSRWSPYL